MKSLTLHLGLPKTATTTLQRHVFPHAPLRLLQPVSHGSSPKGHSDMALPFRPGWLHDGAFGSSPELKKYALWIKSLDADVLFLTSETLSAWSSPGRPEAIWPVMNMPGDCPRSGTHPLVNFLAKLRESLAPEVQLKTILTLRNQADFVGSLAAQVAPLNSNFLDFLLNSDDAFLDWYALVKEIEHVVGSKNHLTLIFENGLHSIVDQIQGFVLPSTLSTGHLTDLLVETENFRQIQKGVWLSDVRAADYSLPVTLARRLFDVPAVARTRPMVRSLYRRFTTNVLGISRHQVTISTHDAEKLRRHYSKSNTELARHLRVDLGPLGYF